MITEQTKLSEGDLETTGKCWRDHDPMADSVREEGIGTIFLVCKDCIHGPCRHIHHSHHAMSSDYACYNSETEGRRAYFVERNLNTEIRSKLTEACTHLEDEYYDLPHEALSEDVHYSDISRCNIFYRCSICGTYYTSIWIYIEDNSICFGCYHRLRRLFEWLNEDEVSSP